MFKLSLSISQTILQDFPACNSSSVWLFSCCSWWWEQLQSSTVHVEVKRHNKLYTYASAIGCGVIYQKTFYWRFSNWVWFWATGHFHYHGVITQILIHSALPTASRSKQKAKEQGHHVWKERSHCKASFSMCFLICISLQICFCFICKDARHLFPKWY